MAWSPCANHRHAGSRAGAQPSVRSSVDSLGGGTDPFRNANGAMSYITHSLGRNETLRYRAHFHWFYYAAAWGALLVSLGAAAEAHGRGLPWAAGLATVLGAAAFLSIMIPIWTTEIGVTNQRFIF